MPVSVKRRALVKAGAATLLGAGLRANAETLQKFRRIGWLYLGQPWDLNPFRQRLHELGWIEGSNMAIEARWAENDLAQLSVLAQDLVDRQVDVIVTQSTPAALAARKATSAIPIVMAGSSNPVFERLVESRSHPSGNVTGVMNSPGPGFSAKLVQLLRQAAAGVSRVAVLERRVDGATAALTRHPPDFGISFAIAEVNSQAAIPDALAEASRWGANAVYVPPSPVNHGAEKLIADFARDRRWPTVGGARAFPANGGLMSYWASWDQIRVQTAEYVDKILRGSKPADLPVELPGKFELVINLTTAKNLRLAVPPSLRLRADELIS